MKRREFIKISLGLASFLAPTVLSSNKIEQKNSVLILGGGFAGLSCAKYIKQLNPTLDVSIIEKNSSFISCPMSNLYLAESMQYKDLSFDYYSSFSFYGFNFINEEVLDINIKEKSVQTRKQKLKYEILIMALGIDYNYKKIFRKNKNKIKRAQEETPAGLKPGKELIKLKKMVENCRGDFVISLPSSSYKCPPAPYERACMIASYFKENKINSKVIILDPRVKPASKAKVYLETFNTIYKGFIEYRNLSKLKDVDFDKKIITYKNEDSIKKLRYTELNLIPPNRANKLYKKAGIKTYAQGWVKLKDNGFKTLNSDDVYVLGDAQGEHPYPKSAQMANSCAYLVAQDLIRRFKNKEFLYKDNLPSNICYSVLTPNKAAWVRHEYYFDKKIKRQAQTSSLNKENYESAILWYKGFMNDLFPKV